MNIEQKKLLDNFIIMSDELFHAEIHKEENQDYRRGFYAGRLFAGLSIKNALEITEGLDCMKIQFEMEK